MISLPKIPYIHRIYMVLANPRDEQLCTFLMHVTPAITRTKDIGREEQQQ